MLAQVDHGTRGLRPQPWTSITAVFSDRSASDDLAEGELKGNATPVVAKNHAQHNKINRI